MEEGPPPSGKEEASSMEAASKRSKNRKFLSGCRILLVEQGAGSVQLEVWRRKIAEAGGETTKTLDNDTIIITNQTAEKTAEWINTHCKRVMYERGKQLSNVTVHNHEWIVQSLLYSRMLPRSEHLVQRPNAPTPPPPPPNVGPVLETVQVVQQEESGSLHEGAAVAAAARAASAAAKSSSSLSRSGSLPATEDSFLQAARAGQGPWVGAPVPDFCNDRPPPPCCCGRQTVMRVVDNEFSARLGQRYFQCPSGTKCFFFEVVDGYPKREHLEFYDAFHYDHRAYSALPLRSTMSDVTARPGPSPVAAKVASPVAAPPMPPAPVPLRYVNDDRLPKMCKCSICLCVLNDPVTAPCKHVFCRTCVGEWLKRATACPECRASLAVTMLRPADATMQRLLAALTVYCRNPGCDWRGPRGNLGEHLSSPCPFTQLPEPDDPSSEERRDDDAVGRKRPKRDPSQPSFPLLAPSGEAAKRTDGQGRVIVDDRRRVEINDVARARQPPAETLPRLADVVPLGVWLDEGDDDHADADADAGIARPASPESPERRAARAFVSGRVYSTFTPPGSSEELLPDQFDADAPSVEGVHYISKTDTVINPYLERNKAKWAVANPNAYEERKGANVNKALCDELLTVAAGYDAQRDEWRARGYKLAAAAIARHKVEIKHPEEARRILGVGERIAAKIGDFLAFGATRKTRLKDDDTRHREDMGRVHGVGPKVIDKLWSQGVRSLEAMRQNPDKLTHVQRIGLKYLEEFEQRIPRAEVAEIEAAVVRVAHAIDPHLTLVTCGSYRRGKPTSGDVDILITHLHHEKVLDTVLEQLVASLTASGLVTDSLTHSDKGADKWMGVCQLRKDLPHRRLDFQLIKREAWPFALLYFTGSEHFNRSMRHWAGKMGYSLSQHALVVRPTAKHVKDMYKMEGVQRVSCLTEEDVFVALKIQYVAPHERDI